MHIYQMIASLHKLKPVPVGLETRLRRPNLFKPVCVKKGDPVPQLRPGYLSGCYVRKGVLKASIPHADGKDEIFLIWKEGQFVSLDNVFFEQLADGWQLTAVKNCELFAMTLSRQQAVYADIGEARDYARLIGDEQQRKRDLLLRILHQGKGRRWALFQHSFPDTWSLLDNRTICALLDISAKTLHRSKLAGLRKK